MCWTTISRTAFLQAAAELHDAPRAVGQEELGAGFDDIVEFFVQEFGGDLGELGRKGAAETAADLRFVGLLVIKTGRTDQVARRIVDPQTAAEVAGGMEGRPPAVSGKVLCFKAEDIVGKRGEIDHLGGKVAGLFQDLRIISKQYRIVMLQMRGAGGAEGDDVIDIFLLEGADILERHVTRGLGLAHHL